MNNKNFLTNRNDFNNEMSEDDFYYLSNLKIRLVILLLEIYCAELLNDMISFDEFEEKYINIFDMYNFSDDEKKYIHKIKSVLFGDSEMNNNEDKGQYDDDYKIKKLGKKEGI